MSAAPRIRFSAPARRSQILEAAAQIFAQRGFRGTTTRQIAQHADVNEALLFRHFPNKEDLYWAVIDEKRRSRGGREHLQAELRAPVAGIAGEKRVFAAIAEGVLRRASQDTTLSRLLLFSALENHRLAHRFFRSYVAGYYEELAAYIRQRIREGRFRAMDPLLAARGFLGMVIYHFLIQELFGGRRYQQFDLRRVSETFADIWLEGMRARNGLRARSVKHKA